MFKEGYKIEIPWTQTAQKYFRGLGYELKKGEPIYVFPEELSRGSCREVEAVCDYCGKEIKMQYRCYVKRVLPEYEKDGLRQKRKSEKV